MVVSRPKHLSRTRSCICVVSISKVCARGGRACCKDQRPIIFVVGGRASNGAIALKEPFIIFPELSEARLDRCSALTGLSCRLAMMVFAGPLLFLESD